MKKIGCKDAAVKLLGFCDRSEKEIREKLFVKGYEEAEIEEAVEFCKEYGYLDDERFTNHFVHDSVELKRYGKRRIRQELKMKGIDEIKIEKSLSMLEDERHILKYEMDRRFGDADLSDKKVKNKVFNFFIRRGFSPNDILWAMGADEFYDE